MLNVTKVAFASALVLAAHSASAQVPNTKYVGSLIDTVTCPQYTVKVNADTEYFYVGATGETVLKLVEPNTLTLGVTTPGNNTDLIFRAPDGHNLDFPFPAVAAPLTYRTKLAIKRQGTDQGHPYLELNIAYPPPPPGSPTDCTRNLSGVVVAVPRGF